MQQSDRLERESLVTLEVSDWTSLVTRTLSSTPVPNDDLEICHVARAYLATQRCIIIDSILMSKMLGLAVC